MHFGEHITIDGYDGDPKLLNDKGTVASAVRELCTLLKMHPLEKPRILSAPDNHLKDPGGWSACVVIAESHISIHTFPRRHFVSADVYTCQNGLDVDFVVDYFKRKFRLGEVEKHFIKRGVKYPKHNKF
jgi:S-adenosylmethionine decarboxylase